MNLEVYMKIGLKCQRKTCKLKILLYGIYIGLKNRIIIRNRYAHLDSGPKTVVVMSPVSRFFKPVVRFYAIDIFLFLS